MTVRDIMTTDPCCCTLETPVSLVARQMIEHDCGAIPVIDENTLRVEGVITDRDLVCRVFTSGKTPDLVTAREAMSSPAVTVTPDMAVEACYELMEVNQFRQIPVIDRHGRCCGIVERSDVAREGPSHETAQFA